jgi:hypothetical protein
VGLGRADAELAVYLANRPALARYQNLSQVQAMQADEHRLISEATGNHWRKIFNVFAKLMYALDGEKQGQRQAHIDCWQHYRDKVLLQSHSNEILLFSRPDFSLPARLHLVAGKQWASALGLIGPSPDHDLVSYGLKQVDECFYVHRHLALVIAPYFDYRQLSNIRLERLVLILDQLRSRR